MTTKPAELAVEVHQPLPVARPSELGPGTIVEMMRTVLDRGVTTENAVALEKLVGLCERMQDREAEKAFSTAFVKLQQEIPKIKATKIIPDNNGKMRSSFAPFEEIDSQARPVCLANGFTYSFSEGPNEPGKITKICRLHHIGGHHRENPYTVRIGKGPPGCSESQQDGSAHSYAKRGALCDCLNIVVTGIDNDARTEGAPITPMKAKELRDRLRNINAPEADFLEFAGVSEFEKIPAVKLEMLEKSLAKKERIYMQKLEGK